MWAVLAIVSALFLGVYDLFKKLSLNKNAVIPVLFVSTLASALMFVPFFLLSRYKPGFEETLFYIPVIPLKQHLLIMVKSVILVFSWLFAYFAMKHLPITIVTPIRATGPLWTLTGALLIYGEQLNQWQWTGLLVTFAFFFLFSLQGSREGISFRNNKWMWFIIFATLTSTASGLYDKFLIANIDRMAVQAYFTFYHVPMFGILMLAIRLPQRQKLNPFEWRWSIPFIGIFLVIADFVYFYALSYDDALIAIVSALRRSSVIVAFGLGAVIFKERNIKQKSLLLLGILAGALIILLGSH